MTFIKDCIYGFIEIPPELKLFVDSPEFQRLRHIKQLGIAHYVYPSAIHTRFEHCLGVMYIAGRFIDTLVNSGTKITPREKLMVQCAGLFHDIGHVAFSHLLDYMLEENKIDCCHEDRSVKLLKKVCERVGFFTVEEIEGIANMIQGNYSQYKKKFLYEIISNSTTGLDVDRFDYLQRDAYHTGLPGFQSGYLLKCVRVKDNRLVFLRKAKEEIDILYTTRRRMFTLVYRHKVIMKIEKVLREIINKLGIITEWKNIDWINLDDVELMYHIKKNSLYKEKILPRLWDKNTDVCDIFQHCTSLTETEINRKKKNIIYI